MLISSVALLAASPLSGAHAYDMDRLGKVRTADDIDHDNLVPETDENNNTCQSNQDKIQINQEGICSAILALW